MLLFVFAIGSKAVSFFKELAIASEFGVGAVADAYILGFTWATWLPGIFVSVTMASIVPIGRSLKHRTPPEDELFFREFAGLSVLIGFVIGGLTAAAPVFFSSFGADSQGVYESLRLTLPVLAVLVPAAFFAAYCSARLVDQQRHSNLAFEALPPAVILIYLLTANNPTLIGLCAATATGYVLYASATGYVLYATVTASAPHQGGQSVRPLLGLRSRGWREFAGAAIIMIVGNACAGSLMVVDQFQASFLPEGSISILGYATRLLMLPATLLSLVIARSMLPVFSEFAAKGQTRQLNRLVRKFALIAFALGLLGAAVIWLLAPWLVQLAFERGSFTAQDTEATVQAMRWGIFQLPGFAAAIVVVQALLSQRRFVVVAVSGIFNLLAKVLLNASLAPFLGVPGITLGTAIVLSGSLLILSYFFFSTTREVTDGG